MRPKFKDFIVPALVALALVGIAAVPAWAYFTASDYASGYLPIKTTDTNIKESFLNREKKVAITNDLDSGPVWVRARAYCAEELDVTIDAPKPWSEERNGWYEYEKILMPGEQTLPTLKVRMEFPFKDKEVADDGTYIISTTGSDEHGEDSGSSEITVGIADGTNYNIVVVYEAQPVEYDASNNPIPPVWPYKGGE